MAGFARCLGMIIRRERVLSTIWVALTVVLTAALAVAYPSLFEGEVNLSDMSDLMTSPMMLALMGPPYDAPILTPMMLFAGEIGIFVMLTLAVMNIFLVNRHTRTDEELGRLEMIRSLPVDRLANAASTIAAAFAVNLLIAVLTAASLIALDPKGMTVSGAICYSLAICAVGCFFAAVTLLTAQLFSSARSASAAALAVLGFCYLLRAAGDMAGSVLSFLSPLGLALQTFAFYEDNTWPVLLIFAESLVVAAIAFILCSRRDLGEGVLPARQGRARATRLLLSPFGLAWRLSRSTALAWCVVMFMTGALYGSVLDGIEDFVYSNELYVQIVMGGTDVSATLAESYTTLLLAVMSLLAVIPVINIANKPHSEERHGRIEPVLARSVSRLGLYGCYLLIAFCMSTATMLCAALGMYAAAMSTGLVELGVIICAALCYLPALWLYMGICVLLTGIAPRLNAAVWVVYGYSFILVYVGRVFNLPDWARLVEPFSKVPHLPVEEFAWVPILAMALISAAMMVIGLAAYRHRDMA